MFDAHIDEQDKHCQNQDQTWDRQRTPFEASVPILGAALQVLIPEFQVEGGAEAALREHLAKLRLDGIDLPAFQAITDPDPAVRFRRREAAVRAMPLGGIDPITPLSVGLARLDREGFASVLVEKLRPRYPEEMAEFVRRLEEPSPLAVQPQPHPAAAAGPSQQQETHPDGPEGGRWVWWRDERHDVPRGTVYRMLAYMWDRDAASYDELFDAEVFQSEVAPQTVRSYANKTNNARPPGLPWRLSTDSVARQLTKIPSGNGG
jgi:hypothetical protein